MLINISDCLPFPFTKTTGIYKLNKALNIPAVAIGGINSENAKDVLSSNVSGLAVSSYLCASEKPYEDAVKLMDIINERV